MTFIAFIVGTRPELIKISPLILELERRGLRDKYVVVNTAQHKDLLDPYWHIFNIVPDYTLDVMYENQDLSSLTSRTLLQLQEFLNHLAEKPSVFLAQGDTTTVMAASMVAFYNKITFIHLEAGLRSGDFDNPFPEEFNRKIASINCRLHLAPTENARQNLLKEGYDEASIKVTGNTVVDALEYIRSLPRFSQSAFANTLKQSMQLRKPVLITCHRRENHGQGLLNVIEAVHQLAIKYREYFFVWSLHPNPNVRSVVENSLLTELDNFQLLPPLDYPDLLVVMKESAVIISDSGGIQEEAPSFSVPVIVLREKTERPEGVDAGIAYLVGTDKEKIISAFERLHNQSDRLFSNPYGDGRSAGRIIDLLTKDFIY